MILAFLLRTLISGAIIAAITLIARRNPAAGAVLGTLPLTSILAMSILWFDTRDNDRIAAYSSAGLWFIVPTLPMFFVLPLLMRQGWGYWPALLMACVTIFPCFWVTSLIAARYGVKL
ncbi:MAG: DUF3147 family protein [Alphaproteobacteria bacterium]|nr:DUF3147 family protein [Alphaproteobacteria bacterium]MDE2041464.1 DUF3147 family protein [Alphaproteobacteria bacterium]MDE2340955.1 DUF3147 family protein [Alphaproteobacteria bacterium]